MTLTQTMSLMKMRTMEKNKTLNIQNHEIVKDFLLNIAKKTRPLQNKMSLSFQAKEEIKFRGI